MEAQREREGTLSIGRRFLLIQENLAGCDGYSHEARELEETRRPKKSREFHYLQAWVRMGNPGRITNRNGANHGRAIHLPVPVPGRMELV
jgi:hypothetical protein